MLIKTSEMSCTVLNWAVAKARGWIDYPADGKEHGRYWHTEPEKAPFDFTILKRDWRPTSNWSQMGPIVEKALIRWNKDDDVFYAWISETHYDPLHTPMLENDPIPHPLAFEYGATLLIAIARCYIASELGDEVDVPDELLNISSN